MTTTLAEQLKRLAVPQTSILTRDKKRASLLFDPKEAATLPKETVYQIGLEGLRELITKNVCFEQYHHNLFHLTSKEFERAVEDSEANLLLNTQIESFLLHLSPYFLLNCTHKALEWLIHRYHIHEYNREELLMLILPYHESNIFVRVVQLLKFKDQNDTWYFLKSLQKPGVHLTKQALLNHAATDTYFLKFVTKFIKKLIKVHENPSLLNLAFNFYCTMFVGTIEYSNEINEDQISQMLPLILKGLKSTIPDFCGASFVIVAKLVAKTTLSSTLLDGFVERVTNLNVNSLQIEATLVLLVLFQSQPQYVELTEISVKNLCELDWLPKILQDLNESGNYIYSFLQVLLKSCTKIGCIKIMGKPRQLITTLMNNIKLDSEYFSLVLW